MFTTWRCLLFYLVAIFSKTIEIEAASSSSNFLNPYPRYAEFNDGNDAGEPLFLTPLIRASNMTKQQVRELAKVNGEQFLGVESYAGYLTVNDNHNSNLFFWYFPAVAKATEASPVLLWLQGGPGSSSLFGLFAENGPFEFDAEGKLQKRKYTWSQTHNLIYIDNPAGTGYSFTDFDEGYARNEQSVALDLHEAVMQLYELFEWDEQNSFWPAGESYAGKYVPSLAFAIHRAQHNKTKKPRKLIPLKGMAIGDGWISPRHQLMHGAYLYELGLIDENGLAIFEAQRKQIAAQIAVNKMETALQMFDKLMNGKESIFYNLTAFDSYYNYLQPTLNMSALQRLGEFIQSTDTRRAIHVGNKTFHDAMQSNKVRDFLARDIMDTVAPWLAELLNLYKVCLYNGQLDIIVGYPLTEHFLSKLKFNAATEYKTAKRQTWWVNGQLAGYVKYAGNLQLVMVRNAGHMVPLDQPEWAYTLIDTLTHAKGNE